MSRTVITVKYTTDKEQYTKKKSNTKQNLSIKSTKEKRIANEKEKQLLEKARNIGLLRVIYKKPNSEPEVKIIDNVFRLKKAIVEYDLEIIPLQNVYIICHNKKQRKGMELNILLDFCSIAGEIIIVQIDRRTREFKSLTQENILWFTEVLNRRSPNNLDFSQDYMKNYNNFSNISSEYFNARQNKKLQKNNLQNNNQQNTNFEEKLLDALTNINLTLSYLIANNNSEVN